MAKKLSGPLGQLLQRHGQMAKKLMSTLLGAGKDLTTETKEEKITPEAKKVMDQTRRDREGNFRAQVRKADVDMETPKERGAMNLEGFKRDKKDMEGSGEYSPFKMKAAQ
jgi:hypothetical protein